MISNKDAEHLIRYLAAKYGISETVAKNLIRDFLFDLNYKLNESENTHIEGIGSFTTSYIEILDDVKLKQLTYRTEDSSIKKSEVSDNKSSFSDPRNVKDGQLSFADIVQRELKDYSASRKDKHSATRNANIFSFISSAQIFKLMTICILLGGFIYLFFVLSDNTGYDYGSIDTVVVSKDSTPIIPVKPQTEPESITLEQAIEARDDILQSEETLESESSDPAFVLYKVGSGETLALIAMKYYGKAMYWKDIVDFNKEVITNPDFLPEGLTIRIPILDIQ